MQILYTTFFCNANLCTAIFVTHICSNTNRPKKKQRRNEITEEPSFRNAISQREKRKGKKKSIDREPMGRNTISQRTYCRETSMSEFQSAKNAESRSQHVRIQRSGKDGFPGNQHVRFPLEKQRAGCQETSMPE